MVAAGELVRVIVPILIGLPTVAVLIYLAIFSVDSITSGFHAQMSLSRASSLGSVVSGTDTFLLDHTSLQRRVSASISSGSLHDMMGLQTPDYNETLASNASAWFASMPRFIEYARNVGSDFLADPLLDALYVASPYHPVGGTDHLEVWKFHRELPPGLVGLMVRHAYMLNRSLDHRYEFQWPATDKPGGLTTEVGSYSVKEYAGPEKDWFLAASDVYPNRVFIGPRMPTYTWATKPAVEIAQAVADPQGRVLVSKLVIQVEDVQAWLARIVGDLSVHADIAILALPPASSGGTIADATLVASTTLLGQNLTVPDEGAAEHPFYRLRQVRDDPRVLEMACGPGGTADCSSVHSAERAAAAGTVWAGLIADEPVPGSTAWRAPVGESGGQWVVVFDVLGSSSLVHQEDRMQVANGLLGLAIVLAVVQIAGMVLFVVWTAFVLRSEATRSVLQDVLPPLLVTPLLEAREQWLAFLQKVRRRRALATHERRQLISPGMTPNTGRPAPLQFVVGRAAVGPANASADSLHSSSAMIWELRKLPPVVATEYDLGAVLFTDIRNFTAQSRALQSSLLVQMLNVMVVQFDVACDESHCTKIKTIGDAYMAVSNLPVQNAHFATNLICLATQCITSARSLDNVFWPGAFEIRVGMAAGPVVAGVIGVQRFAYDVWGTTVNKAARMESAAPPSCIRMDAIIAQEAAKDGFLALPSVSEQDDERRRLRSPQSGAMSPPMSAGVASFSHSFTAVTLPATEPDPSVVSTGSPEEPAAVLPTVMVAASGEKSSALADTSTLSGWQSVSAEPVVVKGFDRALQSVVLSHHRYKTATVEVDPAPKTPGVTSGPLKELSLSAHAKGIRSPTAAVK
eukprot:TRINITY_DN4804_c0_g1_i2.p1 TRINITY_DN4804_c0_g1~~TRINITY_DN4804_c0_g1_i2.p1  ORF type:complete len:858 (+),score=196.17 TRINITY_DN4804_c0_g1_i2:203-2776(+)